MQGTNNIHYLPTRELRYDNTRKITTGQGDDYTTCCLLDHICFKKTATDIKHYSLKQKCYQ